MSDTTHNMVSVYQCFLGRQADANILQHPHKVLIRMKDFDWGTLKKHGFTHIYLLGLFDSTGPVVVNDEAYVDLDKAKNRCPSSFALVDHTRVHPLLGTHDDLRQLIEKLTQLGLAVWVDFVPNHTSTAHPWIKKHPDYYHHAHDGMVREFSGDVVKLNYSSGALRGEMIQVLETIASWGITGVRCDMAHLVPVDFWREAVAAVRKNFSSFTFAAEAYCQSLFDLTAITQLLEAGFDFVYDEPLYRNAKLTSFEGKPATYMRDYLRFALEKLPYHKFLHYAANHDDDDFLRSSQNLVALTILGALLPGGKFGV